MEKILIGYISGTHGLRGDLIVKSKFDKKDKALKKGNNIYLNDEKHEITDVKIYKNNYLIKIDNLKNINLVEHYKAYDVYTTREELNLNENEYILDDLIGMTIEYNNKTYGKVVSIENYGKDTLIRVKKKKEFLIPLIDEYIKEVDLNNKTIKCNDIRGLII